MIVLDVETSGLDPQKHSLLSIGAVEFDTGKEFYAECRIQDYKSVNAYALTVNGFSVTDCHDINKPYDVNIYLQLIEWVKSLNTVPLLAGQQIGSFDVLFLREVYSRTHAPEWIFGHRTVDLHSVAYGKYKKSLSLDQILTELGLAPEPKPHNALVGAKLEREAFKRFL